MVSATMLNFVEFINERKGERLRAGRSGTDWLWQKRWIVKSDWAMERRKLRQLRPRTRRKENSAGEISETNPQSIISLYNLCSWMGLTNSSTAAAAAAADGNSVCGASPL
ncbi:hypothetical protein Ancab_009030 [Ancistrocladus abbreviatus]